MRLRLVFSLTTFYLLLTTLLPSQAKAERDCQIKAEFNGADALVLFKPESYDPINGSKDCGDIPLSAADYNFQHLIDLKTDTLVMGVDQINSKFIHHMLDRDNSFFDYFTGNNQPVMASRAEVNLFPEADVFPNFCVSPEVLTNPAMTLSNAYLAARAIWASSSPALASCLSKGIQINSYDDAANSLKSCYQQLDHSLVKDSPASYEGGDPNILDGNPIDKTTTDEEQFYELRRRCDEVIIPCHNTNKSLNGQACFNDYDVTIGKPTTPYDLCQDLPSDFSGWYGNIFTGQPGLPYSKRAELMGGIPLSKAITPIYVVAIWDPEESDDGALHEEKWQISKFNICGAEIAYQNELDRIRMYSTIDEYTQIFDRLKAYVRSGEAWQNIPYTKDYFYIPPKNDLELAHNKLFERINLKAIGPENTKDLPSQFSGALSTTAKWGSALFHWIKDNLTAPPTTGGHATSDSRVRDFEAATPFTYTDEKSRQYYNAWYVLPPAPAYLHAIGFSKDTQMHRWQPEGLEVENVTQPFPGIESANAKDRPKNFFKCLAYGIVPGPNGQTIRECLEEESPKSGTEIKGEEVRQTFPGGFTLNADYLITQNWLKPPEDQVTECLYTKGIIEPNPTLLQILKAAYPGKYEVHEDATNCPKDPSVTYKNASPVSVSGIINCDQTVEEQSVPGLKKDLGQDLANRWYEIGGTNYWAECNNQVIRDAVKAGVDPIFALAIWIHESAASNYEAGKSYAGKEVEDFGIHTGESGPENFTGQLQEFLDLNYNCPKNLTSWVSMFRYGDSCTPDPSQVDTINNYISELQMIYDAIAPGTTLPSWPR